VVEKLKGMKLENGADMLRRGAEETFGYEHSLRNIGGC
jgi:hypothetical protein